ncbi:MAG: substrate-binding domain-containing protein [Gammaproteobacteria bacterium]|nr:substrate-binding domain-containing protein [Gammaproteobacteria bacterium]
MIKNSRTLILALLLCFSTIVSAERTDSHDFITGAGAHFSWIVMDALKPILEKASGQKLKLYGQASMLGSGCKAGIKLAMENKPGHESFGFVCCPLSDKEIEEKKLRVFPLAKEPVTILVNSANPVTNLSSQQVRDIFQGKINNWKEVGGEDSFIVTVNRLHCSKRPGHWKTILPNKEDFKKDRLNVKSADAMVKRVSDFPSAIGHTGSAWAFKPGDKVKIITINNIKPSGEALQKNQYPFYRELSIVTNQTPSDSVLDIISSAQKELITHPVAKQYHLLPLGTGEYKPK